MWLQPCPACQGAGGIDPWGSPEPSLSPSIPSLVSLRDRPTQQEGTKLSPLQVVKKSCYPRWNETFEFELAEPAREKLCVEVWDWDLVGRNDFLGKVSPKPFQCCQGPAQLHTQPSPAFPSQVVFSVQGLEAAGQEEGWFRLWPDKSKPTEDE